MTERMLSSRRGEVIDDEVGMKSAQERRIPPVSHTSPPASRWSGTLCRRVRSMRIAPLGARCLLLAGPVKAYWDPSSRAVPIAMGPQCSTEDRYCRSRQNRLAPQAASREGYSCVDAEGAGRGGGRRDPVEGHGRTPTSRSGAASLHGAGHLAPPRGPRKTALRAAARDEDLKGMTGAGGGFLLSARRAMTNAGYVVVTVQASTACVLFRGTR